MYESNMEDGSMTMEEMQMDFLEDFTDYLYVDALCAWNELKIENWKLGSAVYAHCGAAIYV